MYIISINFQRKRKTIIGSTVQRTGMVDSLVGLTLELCVQDLLRAWGLVVAFVDCFFEKFPLIVPWLHPGAWKDKSEWKLGLTLIATEVSVSHRKSLQVNSSTRTAWPKEVTSRSKFSTCVCIRVRLARALETIQQSVLYDSLNLYLRCFVLR